MLTKQFFRCCWIYYKTLEPQNKVFIKHDSLLKPDNMALKIYICSIGLNHFPLIPSALVWCQDERSGVLLLPDIFSYLCLVHTSKSSNAMVLYLNNCV